MDRAVGLVPKLMGILRSRGLKEPIKRYTAMDFETVEKELGCALPSDYKALITELPEFTEWGSDPFALFGPDGILKCIKELRDAYVCNESEVGDEPEPKKVKYSSGVELDWSCDTCFIPFGASSSAFYIGWIKETDGTTCSWKVMQLDGENSLEYNGHGGIELPLVELLYRMVVRGVTKDIYDQHQYTCASYFWHSEEESRRVERGTTLYSRDGSQDHAASSDKIIYVFGRPVVFVGAPPPDDDDNQAEEDLETQSVFYGSSEQDFEGVGVGVYNLTHPDDLEEEERERKIKDAVRTRGCISVDSSIPPSPWLDSAVLNDMEPDFRGSVEKAASIGTQFDVADRWAAVIANGRLSVTDPARDALLWDYEAANEKLDRDNEAFVQVALADRFGVALASSGRVLQWDRQKYEAEKGDPQDALHWVPIKDSSQTIKKLTAGSMAAIAILENGNLLFWGHHHCIHADRPEGTEQDPFVIPGISHVVDASIGGQGTTLLHSDGTISLSSRQGIRELGTELPGIQIVAVNDCSSHKLFVSKNGAVYGLGNRACGQLPIAVTAETVAAYTAEVDEYKGKAEIFSKQIDEFRDTILEHCKTCPKAVAEPPQHPPRLFGRFPGQGNQDEVAKLNEELVRKNTAAAFVNGVTHLPNLCGAPTKPSDLVPPAPPRSEIIPGGRAPEHTEEPYPINSPKLLTVGAEQERSISAFSGETDKNAWNCVRGPYGLIPGSFARVVHVSGDYRQSLFLHQDGSLSACGSVFGLGFDASENEEGDDQPPLVGVHCVRTGEFLPTFRNLGMPASVAHAQTFVCTKASGGGSIAVDSEGKLWASGDSMGSKRPTGPFLPLEIFS